jgi:hypothetical protein
MPQAYCAVSGPRDSSAVAERQSSIHADFDDYCVGGHVVAIVAIRSSSTFVFFLIAASSACVGAAGFGGAKEWMPATKSGVTSTCVRG